MDTKLADLPAIFAHGKTKRAVVTRNEILPEISFLIDRDVSKRVQE